VIAVRFAVCLGSRISELAGTAKERNTLSKAFDLLTRTPQSMKHADYESVGFGARFDGERHIKLLLLSTDFVAKSTTLRIPLSRLDSNWVWSNSQQEWVYIARLAAT
jgi:hypothetical protein